MTVDPLVITANPFIVNSKEKPMSLKCPKFHISARPESCACNIETFLQEFFNEDS